MAHASRRPFGPPQHEVVPFIFKQSPHAEEPPQAVSRSMGHESQSARFGMRRALGANTADVFHLIEVQDDLRDTALSDPLHLVIGTARGGGIKSTYHVDNHRLVNVANIYLHGCLPSR